MRATKSFIAGFAGVVLAAGFLVTTGVHPAAVAPTTAASVSFTAAGDFNSTAQTSAVLDTIAGLDPDLHLALGDLSYSTGPEQAWCDYVTARVGAGFPFELISGNHESNGENGNINNFSACLPNQVPGVVGTYGRQYYMDVPQQAPLVRFIQISPGLTYPDGAWSYATGSPRSLWTAAAIDGARAAGIPWVVVSMHKPCLSIGIYACETGADIMNLLVTKRVDLVLSGHEHMYARSKQITTNTGCPAVVPGTYTPACVADSDSDLTKGAGTVFGIVGTGGTVLRNVALADSESGYFSAYSGLNASPTWGPLQITADATTLSARFVPASGVFTDSFTIRAGATQPNQPPTASFTASCTDLACSMDADSTADADGTVVAYDWDFGDGTSGTGVAPLHSYALAGAFTVRLTATDEDGATGTTTRDLVVTAPGGPTVYASDGFGRTVTNGLGTADVGGAWSTIGSTSAYQVNGGAARIRHATAGLSLNAYLLGATSTTTDLSFRIGTDKAIAGADTSVTVYGRRIPGAGTYKARVTLRASGQVALFLAREAPFGTEGSLASTSTITGLTYGLGDELNIRVQVFGTNPTTVRARVWKSGATEPTTWQRSGTDSTPALQAAGSTGIGTNMPGAATNAPVVFSIDDLLMKTP
ncbi:PKD domain-containing protein [Leifsonia sp. Leaf264]|uniref:PKD domain-containing protein n=1 Tax=Leifsonia sp. Leaf264 TaxID=1736314 RepID=UPI0006F73FC0|nr:PKD domain-containing protein [Leifsonia sp. Leaf264]KQO99808.1 hypothetical protein ASF30_07945 [Leifsonia sp. Leaf264]